MVIIRRVKNRKKPVPITPRKKIKYSDLHLLKDQPKKSRIVGRKKSVGFTRQEREILRKKRWAKKISTKEQRKKSRFKRVASLNLGNARQFLILTTPLIVQMDPYLATIYTTWKFGKYGYGIYQKVKKEYDVKGDYNQALQKVVTEEIEEKVISKIKSIPTKNVSQIAANKIWEYHKKHNPENNISPEWDNFAVSAMTKMFEEIGATTL